MLFDDLIQPPLDDNEERRRRVAALMQMQQNTFGPQPLGLGGQGGGQLDRLGLGGQGGGELVPLAQAAPPPIASNGVSNPFVKPATGTGMLFSGNDPDMMQRIEPMAQRIEPSPVLSRITSPEFFQAPQLAQRREMAQAPVAPPAAQPPDIPSMTGSMMGPPAPSMLDNYTPPAWAGWDSVRHDPIMPFTDSFMSPDPVHTLGVNGFRVGGSNPTVDYSGVLQRAHIMSAAKDMMDTFSRNQMELDRAKIMSGGKAGDAENKKEQLFNKSLALTSNPAIDTPQAIAKIKEMQTNKELTPSEANQAILKRVTTRRTPDGKALAPLFHPDKDPLNPDMGQLMSALKSDEVKGMPPEDIKKFLQNSMGITDDMVKKRYVQLIQQGIPWWNKMGMSGNPEFFDQTRLNPDQLTEFQGINTIFGRK